MCGIFGYVGSTSPKASRSKSSFNAAQIVFEGLKRLEYRGYDSWGVAIKPLATGGQRLVVEKHVGKIGNSKLDLSFSTGDSSLALGHTRWATHGGVTQENAHPHLDCSGSIALVHNGIVENYQEIKKNLKSKHKFKSETDTEVVVHLIEELASKLPLDQAVRIAFSKLKGLSAVVVMNGTRLIAAKSGSPLVVGIGRGEFLIASDASALLPHTNKVIFLQDGQGCGINKSGARVFELKTNKKLGAKVETLRWKRQEATLGKYKHFMLKEIYEQSKVVENIAKNFDGEIMKLSKLIKQAHGTFLIGSGTAFHACLAGSYLFSKIAKIHVNTVAASEFNYLEDFLSRDSLVIALSQSGETIDVIEPLKRAKEKKVRIASLVNNPGSTIWQMSDYAINLQAGPEVAVASTKAYIAKLAVLLLTSYCLIGKLGDGKNLLLKAANEVKRILAENGSEFKQMAKILASHEHIFTIGRGLSYQSALEAALKMKEVSYVHTEGLAGGELKHGTLALISKGTPCIVFAPNDETYDAILSNAQEIKSRGGYIIGVSPKNEQVYDKWIDVKDLGDASMIPNVIPSQLFGYYLALEKGLDPDKPRNLAKSVTVK